LFTISPKLLLIPLIGPTVNPWSIGTMIVLIGKQIKRS